MQLNKSQVETILKNAPAGADKTKILDGLIMRGYDLEGVDTAQAKAQIALKTPPAPLTKKEEFQKAGQETTQDLSQIGSDVKTDLAKRNQNIEANKARNAEFEAQPKKAVDPLKIVTDPKKATKEFSMSPDMPDNQTAARTGIQNLGQVLGFGADVIGDTIKGVTKALLPQKNEDKVKENLATLYDNPIVKPIVDAIPVEELSAKYEEWKQQNPNKAADLDAVSGFLEFASNFVGAEGAKVGSEAVAATAKEAGTQVAKQGTKIASEVATQAGKVGNEFSGAVSKATKGVRDVAGVIADEASRIPSRISTNVAEKQATREVIQSLPGKVAQKAAQDGIDPNDVKYLYNIPKEAKTGVKELADTAKKFANGTTKTDPIEIVGKPIVSGIKEATTTLSKIGKKLGDAANNLGTVSSKELGPSVFQQLKKVQGLTGLEVSDKGILNFKNTVLTTKETASDRKAIQSIFRDAIRPGTGKQKHLLRQELFETLGGKKRALMNLTATQEKAYDAIRKGLSDVLESKNPLYKKLSTEYAKTHKPLEDLRKFMKGVAGSQDEDILGMSAGLLARRLTSNAQSNPQIRSILRALDSALGKGKTGITSNTEVMQDIYNVLNKYYDIAGRTSFQGAVKAGIESSSGVMDAIASTVKSVAGETPAVRQKALESILAEILK